MRIVLLGAPGAGKGTQARLICDAYHIPQISTGDMLRSEIVAGSDFGRHIKTIIDSGQLVSDDIIVELALRRLQQADCETGYLLDGVPRTQAQAQALDAQGVALDCVIELDVPDAELIRRLSGRRIHPASGRTYHIEFNPPQIPDQDDITGEPLIQRDDDHKESIRNRLEIYHRETAGLFDYYQEADDVMCHQVDGAGDIDSVQAGIQSKLNAIRAKE